MRTRLVPVLVITLTGLLVVGASSASAQAVERLAAEFQFYPYPPPAPANFPEFQASQHVADGGAGGKVVYTKTLFVKDDGALFVTFWGTADEDSSEDSFNILMMTCLLDGAVCQPGGGQAALSGPTGWIPLQNINPNRADNNIGYSWCVPVQKGPRTVDLKLGVAGNDPTGRVFYERSHIYIDFVKTNKQGDLCNPAAFVPGSTTPP